MFIHSIVSLLNLGLDIFLPVFYLKKKLDVIFLFKYMQSCFCNPVFYFRLINISRCVFVCVCTLYTHIYLQTKWHISDLIFLKIKTWHIIINIGSSGNEYFVVLLKYSFPSFIISKEMGISHLSLWGPVWKQIHSLCLCWLGYSCVIGDKWKA